MMHLMCGGLLSPLLPTHWDLMAQINRQLFQHQIMYLDRNANKSIEESYEESIKTF